ncbi:MAG: beta-ketoacyl-[acyl-carrier-protein] synthase family protein [Acidobacteria bacterium]|nr:beta-ketoacyl-[acyl-carrier-protein] synthase family protein [Acidobacteriota bacterium]
MSDKRVVITGLGIVAPNGIGKQAFWDNSLKGESRIGPITHFNAQNYACRVGGRVEDFNAADYMPSKIIKQTDRSTHMAIAACHLATKDAGLDLSAEDPNDVGMYFANIFGGMEFAEPELYAQAFLGSKRVSAYQAIAWFYAATQGQWSIGTGIRGFGKSIVGDRAGGLQAVAFGALAVNRGHCKVVFAGGFEAPLVPYAFLIHHTSSLLSSHNTDPTLAYRPFDVARSGLVLGEGSGMLVLEEMEHAVARGAHIYAEVSGYATNCDAAHYAEASSDGEQLARCFSQAVERAGMEPSDIDHICADGLATTLADVAEARAINAVFSQGYGGPTVSAPKSMIGHTLGAAGAVDAIWSCLMMQHSVALPTLNLTNPDAQLGLNHVFAEPQAKHIGAALCCARGYGGLNTAVVLRNCQN